ncbi:MORC family CW-type zinc finger protein 3 isoform X2 [Engystomops pustulosus]
MTLEKLHKMLSFGFSDKVAVQGHVPVGLYGNGFKSGSMRLGKDAIVLTKNDAAMHVGMLSQSYLEAINAKHVIVPIISFNKNRQLVMTPDLNANRQAILGHSLLNTEKDLLAELDAIIGKKGTRIIIWNLRQDKSGQAEFDFIFDKYDIRIPEEFDGSSRKGYKKQERIDHVAPDSDYSLRAYCSILYLKPRMQIIIRGQKVQTQLVSKNLAHIEKDVYRPKSISHKPVKITFGYNCRNKEHYGIMMYHRNRLIKAYVRVGCQLKANNMGVGVVGVIECNYLKPTHNKQDFDYTNDYRLTLTAVGEKLNDYWNEMKLQKNMLSSVPVEDEQKRPDQNWAQCDLCLKWRKLPDGIGKLPPKWFCHLNPDPQFRDCNVPEEPEDDDEITHSTYEKTHKKRKSEAAAQVFNKGTILFNPPSKEMQRALNIVQTNYRPATTTNLPQLVAAEASAQPSTPPDRRKRLLPAEPSPVPLKVIQVTETIELPDGDDDEVDDDGDVIIIEDVSTPKPKSDEAKHQNGTGSSPVPMECLDGEMSGVTSAGGMTAVATQTDVPGITIKKEEDDSYSDFHDPQQNTHSDPVYRNCNGNGTHNHEEEATYYKRRCEELSAKLRHLEESAGHRVKMETSPQQTQTDPGDIYSKYDQALKEISRLKLMCKKLQQLKSEPNASPVIEVDSTSEMDDMAIQLDDVFRRLDSCSVERDQFKTKIEQLQLEKMQLEAENNQLKTELQEASNENGASTSHPGNDRTKLRSLRVAVAQLLKTLMPDLDLEQVDYDVDVIDEILDQVLEQAEKQANGHE